MDKEDIIVDGLIETVNSYLKSIKNSNRRKILKLCYKNPKTISELQREIGSNYKLIFEGVKILEKEKLVRLTKVKGRGSPVYVSSNMTPQDALLNLGNIIDQFKKELGKK